MERHLEYSLKFYGGTLHEAFSNDQKASRKQKQPSYPSYQLTVFPKYSTVGTQGGHENWYAWMQVRDLSRRGPIPKRSAQAAARTKLNPLRPLRYRDSGEAQGTSRIAGLRRHHGAAAGRGAIRENLHDGSGRGWLVIGPEVRGIDVYATSPAPSPSSTLKIGMPDRASAASRPGRGHRQVGSEVAELLAIPTSRGSGRSRGSPSGSIVVPTSFRKP
jgi:hypothetical protein